MKKAIVSFPHTDGTRIEVEQNLIQDKTQLADYKKKHPIYYPMVEPLFKRELADGNIIIVNDKGGWCVPSEEIKIVKFID
jgi:hypothetical protein